MYVGVSTETHAKNMYAKIHGRNYVAQTRACSKSVLDGTRNVHLEMINLKQTELQRLKNRGKKC